MNFYFFKNNLVSRGLAGVLVLFTLQVRGEIKSESVEYRDGGTALEGQLYYDDAINKARPGVVVVHEWMGLNDYAKRRAKEMAELGYVALAADIYGKGVHAKDMKEAGELAGKYKGDRKLLRSRGKAAFEVLAKNKMVEPKKIFAMGFCFGGTTALEMGRAGLPLAGIISFHGGSDNPTPTDAKNIKAKVLVLHGAIDPHVTVDQVNAFEKEMNEAKVDYQFIAYSGAVHGFTNPENGNDISKGVAFNAVAEKRSMNEMKEFIHEIISQ